MNAAARRTVAALVLVAGISGGYFAGFAVAYNDRPPVDRAAVARPDTAPPWSLVPVDLTPAPEWVIPCEEDEAAVVARDTNPANGLTWICVNYE